jgi:hypothetical protein
MTSKMIILSSKTVYIVLFGIRLSLEKKRTCNIVQRYIKRKIVQPTPHLSYANYHKYRCTYYEVNNYFH